MATSSRDLKAQLAELPFEERADLAGFLMATLDDESPIGEETEFDAELRRRIAEIENGTAIGIPASEVFSRMEKTYP